MKNNESLNIANSTVDLPTNHKTLIITAPYIQGLSIKPPRGATVLAEVLKERGVSKSRAEGVDLSHSKYHTIGLPSGTREC